MANILLIYPPFNFVGAPPVGIAYLVSTLRKTHNQQVQVSDLNIEFYHRCLEEVLAGRLPATLTGVWNSGSYMHRRHAAALFFGKTNVPPVQFPLFLELLRECLHQQIKAFLEAKFDVVGISVTDSALFPALYLGREIKARCSDVHLTFGGPLFNPLFAKRYLEEFPFIDSVVVGEGEETLEELVQCLATGNSDSLYIPGVFVRQSTTAGPFSGRQPIQSLDALPIPDFSDFDLSRYLGRCYREHIVKPTLPILASRGCAWARCSFCSDPTIWPVYRRRSAARVVEEMIMQSLRFKCFNFMFCDLALNGDITLLSKLCDRLQSIEQEFLWDCMIRPVPINRALMGNMAKAGCVSVFIGIESVCPRIISDMNKGNTIEDNVNVLRLAVAEDILVMFNLMASYPRETHEEVAHTHKFLRDNESWLRGNTQVFISRCTLTHGSPMWRNPKRYDVAAGDTRYGDGIPLGIQKTIPFYEHTLIDKAETSDSQKEEKAIAWDKIATLIQEWNNDPALRTQRDFFLDLLTFLVVSKNGRIFTLDAKLLRDIVLCLFQRRLSKKKLAMKLSDFSTTAIDKALGTLLSLGIVAKQNGCYKLTIGPFRKSQCNQPRTYKEKQHE